MMEGRKEGKEERGRRVTRRREGNNANNAGRQEDVKKGKECTER
jgi:hypothetical protein